MKKKIVVAGGGLVQNEKGELLMIFRRGKWDLPKGKLDPGETIEHCALREVKEETGLRNVILGKLIDISTHEYFDAFLSEEVVKETHWYEMIANGEQILTPQSEEDITDIKWVTNQELKKCLLNSYVNVVAIISKANQKKINLLQIATPIARL